MSPGDLVYYDKSGGLYISGFPFSDPSVKGVGIVISEIKSYDYGGEIIKWVKIINENGEQLDYSLDYLEPVIT